MLCDFFFQLLFQASNQPAFYFIDCAFSVIVIGTLVVLVWRSLWVLCDLLIFPSEPTLSAWYSLVWLHFNLLVYLMNISILTIAKPLDDVYVCVCVYYENPF